jgi:hypothetical protein
LGISNGRVYHLFEAIKNKGYAMGGNGDMTKQHREVLLDGMAGVDLTTTAQRLGITVAEARRIRAFQDKVAGDLEEPDDDEQPFTDLGNCKCGLRLPCNDCLPTIDELGSRRTVQDESRSGKRGDRKGRSGFADHAFAEAVDRAYRRIVPSWDRPQGYCARAKGK